jgi:hypothetical protein
MLSEDDVNLRELSDEELERAWDLWFELAQTTNAWDPPYSHGVFVGIDARDDIRTSERAAPPTLDDQ